MAKITIVNKTPFQKENWNGFIYIAFRKENPTQAFQFSSQKDHALVGGAIAYDPEQNEEVNLKVKLWDGKMRFSEI